MNKEKLNLYASSIKLGSERAFEQMYEETIKGVFAFVYSILADYAATEETVQDAYIKVKLNISSFKESTNFSAWLLEIAKNSAYDYIRKNRREISYPDDALQAAAGPARRQDFDRPVLEAMNRVLSADEKQIVILHAVSGYKHREISKLIEKPLGTVTWTYNNAVKKLAKYLKEEGL